MIVSLGADAHVTKAHPESQFGDVEWAYYKGWDLIGFTPNGLLLYRRVSYWSRIWRKFCHRYL